MEKESLMLNPLSYPEEKFTKDGKSYYYTRGDGTPITNESWSLKDLAYPLNVPFGGKRQGNLSDWSFTNWLVNAAPGQLAPIGAAVKGIKTMRNQHRTSPHGFYKEGSVDGKKANQIIDDIVINRTDKIIPKYSSGPIVQTNEGTMYRPVPGTMQSTFESMRKRKGESESQFSNRYFDAKFQKIGLNEDAILSLKNMLDAKDVTQRQRRELKTGISNPNYSMKTYKQTRQILVDEFLNGLEFLGLSPKDIEAHHITGLRQTASLFEGLQRSEFPEMLQLIYDEGLTTGNDPKNLMAIQKKAHYNKKDNPNITAVHTYLTKELGLYGQKIVGDFGVDIRDLSPQERIPYIKKFAAVVKGSYPVAEKAIRAVLDENVMDASPEALVDASLDIDKSQVKIIKAAIDDYITLQLTEPNHQALLDSIFGDESAGETMRRRGINPRTPIQSQLLDLGKKPPKKTKKKPKDIEPGTGAYWDIESE